MTRWRSTAHAALGATVAALMAIGLVGCADNDGTTRLTREAEPASTTAVEQADVAGTTPTEEPTPRPPGTDAEYVSEVCAALGRFFDDFEAATHRITPDDPAGVAGEFADAFGPALARLAEDLRVAAPPADIQVWHDGAVESLFNIAATIEEGGGLGEIARLGDRPLPAIPEDFQQRLTSAAATARECARFDDAFGG